MEKPTFDQLPVFVLGLKEDIRRLSMFIEEKMQPYQEDRILSLKEAGKYLNIKPNTLAKKCRAREITYTKKGRVMVFRKIWLDEFLNKNAVKALK
jgi:excisionase family DNA binding protein